MKTLVRLIRRYVLLAVGLSLLLIVLGLALIIWVGIRFGLVWQEQFRYSYMELQTSCSRMTQVRCPSGRRMHPTG